ncbi:MAG: hypothetical protein NC081_08425 [Roseburia sp.]|nr:hypothetical protein [Roseburia sp.]
MSPLWSFSRNYIRNYVTNQPNPSPNHMEKILRQAHGAGRSFIRTIKKLSPKRHKPIEGISVPISLTGKLGAGMTVEASLVLPLFLFFFLNLSSTMEIIRLHGNLEMALWEIGSRMSIYGYALSDEKKLQDRAGTGESWWYELADMAFSYGYVKQKLVDYVGEDYLEGSPLTYGADGLQFVGSDVFSQSDHLEIVLTYQVSPLCAVPGFRSFLMENHYLGHLWTGYEIPGTGEGSRQKLVLYYVAENGEVYHISGECTHLKLTKRRVSLTEALSARNAQGGRYTRCGKCKKETSSDMVWIPDIGEHYHYSESCSGLKRTIYTITEEEIIGYRACSRCVEKSDASPGNQQGE